MEGTKIFPFYVVVDVSASMSGCLGVLNSELPALKDAVDEDPIVGELARFGLVTFSDDAQQLLPLSDLMDVPAMPTLQPQGSTSYAAAFELLYELLPHDLDWFKSEGYLPLRPVVFFISDGQPNARDPWSQWLQTITDTGWKYHPHIVAFGFGDVREDTLREVATFRAYAAHTDQNPATVLRSITEALTNSIIVSSQSAASGQTNLSMPQQIDGMYEIELDVV